MSIWMAGRFRIVDIEICDGFTFLIVDRRELLNVCRNCGRLQDSAAEFPLRKWGKLRCSQAKLSSVRQIRHLQFSYSICIFLPLPIFLPLAMVILPLPVCSNKIQLRKRGEACTAPLRRPFSLSTTKRKEAREGE